MSKDFVYTGRDNLDVMSYAKKYNDYIFMWLKKDLKNGDKILDFGSGHGEFFNRFDKNKYSLKAVEPDLNMHEQYPTNSIHESIEELKMNFDLIYSVNVLEHIYDDQEVIQLFKKYLKDHNSSLKIFVPARQELFSEMDKKVGHYRRYSKSQLEKLFIENGYKVKSCYYFDSIGYFAALAYKLFNKDGNINKGGIFFYDRFIFPLSILFDKLLRHFIGKNIILEVSLK